MNLQEFADLKPGDKVVNLMSGSAGEVVEALPNGVRVSWGGNSLPFFYSVQTTAWTHWSTPDATE